MKILQNTKNTKTNQPTPNPNTAAFFLYLHQLLNQTQEGGEVHWKTAAKRGTSQSGEVREKVNHWTFTNGLFPLCKMPWCTCRLLMQAKCDEQNHFCFILPLQTYCLQYCVDRGKINACCRRILHPADGLDRGHNLASLFCSRYKYQQCLVGISAGAFTPSILY